MRTAAPPALPSEDADKLVGRTAASAQDHGATASAGSQAVPPPPPRAGSGGAAREGHSPGQELEEDHITAAACEHQANREGRAHGRSGERRASAQMRRPLIRPPQEAGLLRPPRHRTSPQCHSAALLRRRRRLPFPRGRHQRSRPRSCSSQPAWAPFIRGGVPVPARLHIPGCCAPSRQAVWRPASGFFR